MGLAGGRVVVSAGPTFEDIDPVRFIGNRSSGKMGFAIAAEAVKRGAQVVLVAGPVALPTPAGLQRVDVRSAAQMHAAVLAALPADLYIGTAAVADFTPAVVASDKIKKVPGKDTLVLELVRTRDILAEVATHRHRPAVVVGFAAETRNLQGYARDKLARKQVDMIVANQVGVADSGFEVDQNTVHVFWDQQQRQVGPASKQEIAATLLDMVVARMPGC